MSSLRIGIMKPGSASFLRITSPIANSFLTPGLPVCAVKTNNLLDGFMAEPRINFIPGIRAPAQAPAIDPHAVTRYRQFWGHLGRRVQYPPLRVSHSAEAKRGHLCAPGQHRGSAA